jgi:hypothetical protein
MSDPTSPEQSDSLPSLEGLPASSSAPEASVGDPTGPDSADTDAALHPAPLPLPVPIPLPLLKRAVSGRYRGTLGAYQLEARVDVDRTRPTNRLSGDFFQTSGSTTTYFGSFVVQAPVITVTATTVVARGLGSFTFSAGAPVVQITVPRRTILQPQAPATVQFFTTGGSPGSSYLCAFESVYFRTVRLETDRVSDVTLPVFGSYNTGALPSGGAARNLGVVSAYAEAGIEMVPTTGGDVINIAEAGAGAKWSNAELHAAMQRHFTLWRDTEQWAVWQLVAQLHDLGPGLYGIMFDQQGRQRQGCAVFHAGIGGTTADKLRLQLYTYVHELGHCFNLLHSWQKQYATPPVPNRPDALSWMNYPWYYPSGGAATFWNKFPFQFDTAEVVHLRHALRNNIIMGGSNFAAGAALGREVMPEPVRDQSGLRLQISTHQPSVALGEPVVLQIALEATEARGRHVHTWLHPNCGLVKIAISKPSGEVVTYEPLLDHLVGAREQFLARDAQVQDSAYIGYGRDGFYFSQPGYYRIRAAYAAIDGSEVLSDILTLRVRFPVTAADESIADLFMGDQQGGLLYLLGSDSEALDQGNAAFDEVLDRHAKHPMANYARLVKGINAGRDFKTVTEATASRLSVRPAQIDTSIRLLSAVVEAKGLDTVSTRMVMGNLAEAQSRAGDDAGASKTLAALAALK